MLKPMLAALVLLAPAPALAARPGIVEFEVIMNGSPVGRHRVEVREDGGAVTADVRIDMKGRVGPIGFTYAHSCTERYAGTRLQSLDCVDREGRRTQTVRASREGEGLRIAGPRNSGLAPASVVPTSWWNAAILRQSQVLDTRNGRVIPLRVERIGAETLTADGRQVAATRYRVRGSATADLWYDGEGRWLKMQFRLRGQSFVYRKLTPIASAPSA